jgi:hypothetical protein
MQSWLEPESGDKVRIPSGLLQSRYVAGRLHPLDRRRTVLDIAKNTRFLRLVERTIPRFAA